MISRNVRQAVITLLAASAMAPVWAGTPKPPKASPDLPKSGSADVIIRYHKSVTEDQIAKAVSLGGTLKTKLKSINGAALTMPASSLASLANDPEVKYIAPDRTVKGALDYANPAVNANIALQAGFDGTGVGIAIIDSGVASHEDLKANPGKQGPGNRLVFEENLVPGSSPKDEYGHGTHVAGILIGDGVRSGNSNDTHTFRGIAPNATVVSFKVLDANGNGTDSAVITAIEDAVALKSKYNIRVINLSLGRPVYESYTQDPLCQAAEWAWQNGVVVVVAAGNNGRDNSNGNNGYGTITAPGNDPYVITVGAMKDEGTISRADDQIASYSSKGPSLFDLVVKPDIVAPGNRIISLTNGKAGLYTEAKNDSTPGAGLAVVPIAYYEANGKAQPSTDYLRLSGTSMAAPMVSGAAALLIQKDPTLTPDQVKARLMLTATKNFPASSVATDPVTGATYSSQYDIFTVGAGYLDVWAALQDNHKVQGSAASPAAVLDSTGHIWLADTNKINSSGLSTVWGSGSDWGLTTVWGSSVLQDASSGPSGTSTVWGSTTVWGSGYIGGATTVWGSGTPSGATAVWGSGSPSGSTTVWGSSSSLAGEN